MSCLKYLFQILIIVIKSYIRYHDHYLRDLSIEKFKAAKFSHTGNPSKQCLLRLRKSYPNTVLITSNVIVLIVSIQHSRHWLSILMHTIHMFNNCMQPTQCSRHTIRKRYRNSFRSWKKFTMTCVASCRSRFFKEQKQSQQEWAYRCAEF